MKAITIRSFGDPSVLTSQDVPSPPLGPGQVRIRVRASGVNRADTVQRRGHYPPPPGESEIPGLEVAGEVVECGRGTTRFVKGARVMALLAGGGYAEEAAVDERLCLNLPARFSFEEGAAIPEVFLTAHHNLFTLGGAEELSRILIHAGGSGVGTAGIQLLRAIGATVFATVGSQEKADTCRLLGARPILYRTESFTEVVRVESQQAGANLILDPVGASYLAENLKCLAPDGRLVLIGLMGGREAPLDLSLVLMRRLQIIGSTLRALPLARKADIVERFRARFFASLENGALRPVMDRIYPATEAAAAHRRMEANENIGKIVLKWGA